MNNRECDLTRHDESLPQLKTELESESDTLPRSKCASDAQKLNVLQRSLISLFKSTSLPTRPLGVADADRLNQSTKETPVSSSRAPRKLSDCYDRITTGAPNLSQVYL